VLLGTLRQSAFKNRFYKRANASRTPALQQRPQVKGTVTKVTTMSPKKPNSASRHIAKVKLTNTINITARIPGVGYICSRYNRVLANGGRANDLPGVGYTIVRGVYDFSPLISKRKRRSVYGVSRPDSTPKHIRRCFRSQQRQK
jgi:small subunit ribosomal protein S12